MSLTSETSVVPPAHRPPGLGELPNGTPLPPRHMTEAEFLAWGDEDVRAEWVDGEVILMPAENLIHIDLNYWLAWLLRLFVDRTGIGGRVVGSGLYVRLSAQRRLRVPDLLYVRPERIQLLQPTLLDGPPDLALEIVSPESQSRDRELKFKEFEAAGVREYWIVDPMSKTVEAYALDAAQKYLRVPEAEGKIHSAVVPGFYLRPEWLWMQPLPDVIAIARELGVTV